MSCSNSEHKLRFLVSRKIAVGAIRCSNKLMDRIRWKTHLCMALAHQCCRCEKRRRVTSQSNLPSFDEAMEDGVVLWTQFRQQLPLLLHPIEYESIQYEHTLGEVGNLLWLEKQSRFRSLCYYQVINRKTKNLNWINWNAYEEELCQFGHRTRPARGPVKWRPGPARNRSGF